jgi:hypothetical protein
MRFCNEQRNKKVIRRFGGYILSHAVCHVWDSLLQRAGKALCRGNVKMLL